MREESATTGFPSLMPGVKREFLVPWLMWAQTHDAPVDEYYWGKYYEGKWTERIKWSPYLMRVCWLYRNPAYGLAEALGFVQWEVSPDVERDDGNWRKPVNAVQYWTAWNRLGQFGFMVRGQVRVFGRRYMEYRLGYGLYRESPVRRRGMLYARVLKFRRY